MVIRKEWILNGSGTSPINTVLQSSENYNFDEIAYMTLTYAKTYINNFQIYQVNSNFFEPILQFGDYSGGVTVENLANIANKLCFIIANGVLNIRVSDYNNKVLKNPSGKIIELKNAEVIYGGNNMDDKALLENITFKVKNLKNFSYENVTAITCAIIKKHHIHPMIVHYESTNKIWKNFYINSQEAQFCHLMRKCSELAYHFNSFSLVWELIPPDNEESIFINHKRVDLNHCNGLSICKNISDDLLISIIFCGPRNHTDFINNFLKNKKTFLKHLLCV